MGPAQIIQAYLLISKALTLIPPGITPEIRRWTFLGKGDIIWPTTKTLGKSTTSLFHFLNYSSKIYIA
jgi:hypothetical protein